MNELEQHHIRYLEIHGEDEIIMLSHEGHRKVHAEDRANEAKRIPEWVVDAAHQRSPERKSAYQKYNQSDEGKARSVKYEQSEKGKAVRLAVNVRYAQSKKSKVEVS